MEELIQFGVFATLMVVGAFAGSYSEKRHFESIRKRELATVKFPTINFDFREEGQTIEQAGLVTGSVVVSLDYFKRILATLRGIVGGRVTTYEPLLDRGRREALLRLKEEARVKGYDSVINVRIETSSLASARADGKGNAGIEILAFGTGIRYRNHDR